MATYLYRIGGWAFTNRRKVLFGWLAILAVVIGCAASFSGQFSSKFEVPGTESQRAQDLLHEKYPGAGGASARVVFAAPEGEKLTDPENKAAIMETVGEAKRADGVSFVIDPYRAKAISKDGRIGYADVIYPMPADEVSDAARDELEESAKPAHAAGMEVEFGGGLVTDEAEAGSESAGIMIGFLVLAITLGSLVAAGLPLLTAILGVAISVGTVTALTGSIELTETAPTLATMLGLAVGIDYALFILSRYRQNVDGGMELRDAAAQATGTAGSAVVFAGATVVIALVGLTVVNIPFLTVMGLAAAGAVVIAVLIATTLLPALLGFFGRRGARVNRDAHVAAVATPRRPRGGERALRALRDAAAVGGAGDRPGGAPRGRAAGDAHEARPARRRLEADRQHRAQGVRPAERGLRPRLQRRADRRGRRAGAAARAAEAAGERRRGRAGGLPARGGRLASGSERAG